MSRTRRNAAKAATAKNETKTDAKGLSLLSAAIEVLKESAEPLNCRQMVEAVKAKGLWTPGAGKTPEQTLYSSIKREIASKGDASRFVLSQVKGHFALRPLNGYTASYPKSPDAHLSA